MTRIITLAAVAITAAGIASANPFVEHALQSDERANAASLAQGPNNIITYSTRSPSVSALELAYRHAVENDDRQKARVLAQRLGL